MKAYRFKFFLLVFLFCYAWPSLAQQKAMAISTDSVVVIGREKLISLSIKINNPTDVDFDGFIVPVLPKGFGLTSALPIKIRVGKNSHAFYPFKFLVLSNADVKIKAMVFQLKDAKELTLTSFTTKIDLFAIRATELVILNPSILLKQIGDSVYINLLVRNLGNQEEELKLVASFPGENGQGKNILQKDTRLLPGTEQQINFGKIITRELYQLNSFYVNVAGLYKNGDLFGNGIAYVQNAAASRQYVNAEIPLGTLNQGGSNQLSLSGQNLFGDSQSWQLNGSGATQVGNGVLGFSVDAYQWNSINNKPLISNTFLNFEEGKKGITAGNISENLESFINGRGIKLYTIDEENKHGMEVAVVQKSYNLLGDNFNYGYSAYLKTSLKDSSGHEYNNTLIFDYAPFEQTRSLLSANSLSLLNKKQLAISVNVGGGLSQNLLDATDIKPSLSLGASLSGSFKKINFSSSNFFSTAYYPGIRKGVLQLNERISKYFGSQNFWIGYSRYGFNPSYLNNLLLFQRNYMLQRIETGWAIPVSASLNLTFTASREEEKANYNSLFAETSRFSAYRLNESLNWHSSDFKQNVYVTIDNGFGKRSEGKSELQLRMNANWSNGWLNLNAYLQKGSFLLAESFNNGITDQQIYRYSISPSFRHEFFNKKLRIDAGLIFYRDALYGNNITYLAKSEYRLASKTAIYVSSYEYQYRNNFTNSSFRSLQAGVTQKLPDPKQHIAGKKGDLEILLYKDNNQNGVFDEGDETASNGTILINKIIFIIPTNGKIQYKRVPFGSYLLSMPIQNGFQVAPQMIKMDQKNTKIAVAMQKGGNVTGKVLIDVNDKTSREINVSLSGITILIKSKNSNAINSVKTGENGQFSIYLPEGNYEVYPDSSQMPTNVYFDSNPQEISVRAENSVEISTIHLKVREKKIEIKRFKN